MDEERKQTVFTMVKALIFTVIALIIYHMAANSTTYNSSEVLHKPEAKPDQDSRYQYPGGERVMWKTVSLHKALQPCIENGQDDARKMGFDPDFNDVPLEHAQGVKIRHDAIEIQHTGLYFVYMSVNLQLNSNTSISSHQEKMPVNCRTFRVHQNSPDHKELLRGISFTFTANNGAQETKYKADLIHFMVGDLIIVEASNCNMIKFDKTATFLGMIMIGNGNGNEKMVFSD